MYLDKLGYVLGMENTDGETQKSPGKIYSEATSVNNPINRMAFEKALGIKRNG